MRDRANHANSFTHRHRLRDRRLCKQCPLGTICPGFTRLLPELCPPGFVCDSPGLPIPSVRCPAGNFCPGNAVTQDPLAPLDVAQLQRSSPVPLVVATLRPLPCLPTTYCMDGVVDNITIENSFSHPQPCKQVRGASLYCACCPRRRC